MPRAATSRTLAIASVAASSRLIRRTDYHGRTTRRLFGRRTCTLLACAFLIGGNALALESAPDGELARARALFTDGLADQEAGRTASALEKFRQVAEVRDTSQVE